MYSFLDIGINCMFFSNQRFPCCGKAYPCDICHDEKEDHEMQFAKKMICGVCSKEQVDENY